MWNITYKTQNGNFPRRIAAIGAHKGQTEAEIIEYFETHYSNCEIISVVFI